MLYAASALDRFPVGSYLLNFGQRARVLAHDAERGLLVIACSLDYTGDKWYANPELCAECE